MDQACRILDPTDPKPLQDRQLAINRRQFFSRGATGIGTAALAGLLGRDSLLATPSSKQGGALGASHLPAKAKRVIYLFQNGAPTHVDLFVPWSGVALMTGGRKAKGKTRQQISTISFLKEHMKQDRPYLLLQDSG